MHGFAVSQLLDSSGRYVTGWLLADREQASLTERLIAEAATQQGIAAGQLTLHADRGSSMTSKPVALLLADLGILKTHARPHVSDDNPYSEAQFKTLKYRPDFPARFSGIEEARAFCQAFFPWYNTEHRHFGLGLLPPAVIHAGQAETVRAVRCQVLTTADARHPERCVRRPPEPPPLLSAAWINPPPPRSPAPSTSSSSSVLLPSALPTAEGSQQFHASCASLLLTGSGGRVAVPAAERTEDEWAPAAEARRPWWNFW